MASPIPHDERMRRTLSGASSVSTVSYDQPRGHHPHHEGLRGGGGAGLFVNDRDFDDTSDQPTLTANGRVEEEEERVGPPRPVFDRFDLWFGGRKNLAPVLGRRHIFMISIGGTIGMGLVLNSGEILRLSGSTGVIVAYALMGVVIAAIMSCIAEMVSLIPEAGAITLFPSRFVDPSLGFAVGIGYWFTNCMALTSLTTATAILSSWWPREVVDLAMGWRIFIFLFIIIVINVMGAKVYGEVEHFFGWMKIVTIVGLSILMLAISCGAGANVPADQQNSQLRGKHYYGITYWKGNYTMPSTYEGHPSITGGGANFLQMWTSFVKAAFAYIGVEIVAVCAGEAKYPRRDVPAAAKSVFIVTILIYTFSVIFVSLVVPWTNEKLLLVSDPTDSYTGDRSPFIIAIKLAGLKVLPGLVNGGFLFMAWTAANTALYVASRVLHGMCFGLDKDTSRFLWPLGRTRKKNGAPVMAILVSCLFAPLAWLLCARHEPPKKLLDVFVRMGTVAALLTWGSQCLAFLRFYFGLKFSMHDRTGPSYPYMSRFQPLTAIFGLTSCTLLIIFNGWDIFLDHTPEHPFQAYKLVASYGWLVVFIAIYTAHKMYYKTEMTPLRNLDYTSLRSDGDREPDPTKHGRIRKLIELRAPTSRKVREIDPV